MKTQARGKDLGQPPIHTTDLEPTPSLLSRHKDKLIMAGLGLTVLTLFSTLIFRSSALTNQFIPLSLTSSTNTTGSVQPVPDATAAGGSYLKFVSTGGGGGGPTGTKCVVTLPGGGGSSSVTYHKDSSRYESRGTNLPPGGDGNTLEAEIANVEAAIDGCGQIIFHGFSAGGFQGLRLYCSGQDFGGRTIGYVLDDPAPDLPATCNPAPGVKVAVYMDPTSPWAPSVIPQMESLLGVAVDTSRHTCHCVQTDLKEITTDIWWNSGGADPSPNPPSSSGGSLPAHVRIMALGDSVTYGAASPDGYRQFLLDKLNTVSGHTYTYVGSVKDSANASEGHSGWCIQLPCYSSAALLPNIPSWIQSNPADLFIVNGGINDLASNQSQSQVLASWNLMIDTIFDNAPDATVIVVPLSSRDSYGDWIQFSANLASMVAQRRGAGERIYYAPLENMSGFQNFADEVHPNQSGYRLMADVLFGTIQPLL